MRPPVPLPPASRWAAKPIVISSGNGIRAVQKAFDLIMQGTDTLDAVIEGVKIQELDPNDNSVGYGGLPNAAGVVQLDASCMHGPTKRAGAVGCLEGIKTPSEVAKLVLKYTKHVFLVGAGAKQFALSYGFKEDELLTPESREAWLRWRANLSPNDDFLDVSEGEKMVVRPTGTINCNAVTPQGDLSSVTTTSGLAWKIPGRVGDSPIIGAGQYCDNTIGAAGSTGLGEANIKICGGFSHGGAHAPRYEADRRRPGDLEACRRDDGGAAARARRPAPVPAHLPRGQQARRLRVGLTLPQPLRRP